jgi:hypothetical protein
VWGRVDQSELWKGEERIGLPLRLVEVGRYEDWPCKGDSGRWAGVSGGDLCIVLLVIVHPNQVAEF